MAQFLWGTKKTFEKHYRDKLLVMMHEDSVLQFTVLLKKRPGPDHDPHSVQSNRIDFVKDDWYVDKDMLTHEAMARNFIWCQFDATVQALYYIHYKPTTRISLDLEKDDDDTTPDVTMRPTLSALQFHDELPRETVVSNKYILIIVGAFCFNMQTSLSNPQLNIPLNLPTVPNTQVMYEDDTIPLRIHDSSLNLVIVSNENGMLFVCHYYLYQVSEIITLSNSACLENNSIAFIFTLYKIFSANEIW